MTNYRGGKPNRANLGQPVFRLFLQIKTQKETDHDCFTRFKTRPKRILEKLSRNQNQNHKQIQSINTIPYHTKPGPIEQNQNNLVNQLNFSVILFNFFNPK